MAGADGLYRLYGPSAYREETIPGSYIAAFLDVMGEASAESDELESSLPRE